MPKDRARANNENLSNRTTYEPFLNPRHNYEHHDNDYVQKHRVSHLAHTCHELVRCAHECYGNENTSAPMNERGLDTSFIVIRSILSDLIFEIEELEAGL